MIEDFIQNIIPYLMPFGYFGVLIISVLANSTIFIGVPSHAIIFALGYSFNPYLLGIFGGIGAGIGELTSYFLGLGSNKLLDLETDYKTWGKWIIKFKELINKHGFWTIVIFNATPLPTDLIAIIAGSYNFGARRFLIASIIGKIISYTAIAIGANNFFNWIL